MKIAPVTCSVRVVGGCGVEPDVLQFIPPPAYVFFGSLGVGVTPLLPSVGLLTLIMCQNKLPGDLKIQENRSVVLGPVPCQRTPLPLSVVLAFGLQTANLPRPPIAAIRQLPTGYLSECFERRDPGVQSTYIHIATVNYTHTYRLHAVCCYRRHGVLGE